MVTRGGQGAGDWMKAVNRYKLPVMRLMRTGGVLHNMINMNTAVCYIRRLLRVNPESSHHKEKCFSSFSNVVSIGDDRCSLNFTMSVSQIIMLHTLHLNRAVCQVCLNKT